MSTCKCHRNKGKSLKNSPTVQHTIGKDRKIVKVCVQAQWLNRPALISIFCSIKRLEGFLLLPGWHGMHVHCRVIHQHYICWYPFIRWAERGTAKVKCRAQEHNAGSWLGLLPGPLNLEATRLTIRRPPHLCVIKPAEAPCYKDFQVLPISPIFMKWRWAKIL